MAKHPAKKLKFEFLSLDSYSIYMSPIITIRLIENVVFDVFTTPYYVFPFHINGKCNYALGGMV